MKITVNRFLTNGDATVSKISIDGVNLGFFGLEDEHRASKISGETRIPAGEYALKLRRVGGFHSRYSTRFPRLHKGMIEICNVPNFSDVLIHIGNTEADTAGCLLIGQRYYEASGELILINSTAAYQDFYERVVNAVADGSATIECIDSDRAEK